MQMCELALRAPRRTRPFRPLWRRLCRRDADPRARRTARAIRALPRRSGVRRRVRVRAQALRRPAEPDLPRQALVGKARRRADLSQARGPEPHRRAQDQQHHRPGAACKRMGKKRVIAETGAGQHGVATATVAARFGMECVVYMGSEDIKRQAQNVFRMKLLGAERGAGRIGLEDAEGRAERSDARLGDQCREHVLHHRHRRGTASVSDDGARFPERDRHANACRRCRR